jgi:pyruvate,water dikinase
VFPYVENHKFYCEHWLTTSFFNKVREFGSLLSRFGVIDQQEDVFHLQHTEVEQALAAVMNSWAAGSPPANPNHWKVIVKERRAMLKVLAGCQAPPATGPMPDNIEDPALQMLWGITTETLHRWALPPALIPANSKAMPPRPAWWKALHACCATSTISAKYRKATSWCVR